MNIEGGEVIPSASGTVPTSVGDISVGLAVGSRLGSRVSCDAEGITPRISSTPSSIGVKSCDTSALFSAAVPIPITISMTTAPTRRAADSRRTNRMRGGASVNHVGNGNTRPFSSFGLLLVCLSMEAFGGDSFLPANRVERRLIISIPSVPDGGSGAHSLPKCKLGDSPLSLSTTEA